MVTGTLWPHLAQGIETDSAPENVVMVLLRCNQLFEFDGILRPLVRERNRRN